MNLRITFRGIYHSAALEEYANEHMTKIMKLLQKEPEPIHFDLVLQSGDHKKITVELRLNAKHYHLIAHHQGTEIYAEVDKVFDIMLSEIKKHREKALDKRDHPEIHNYKNE